MEAKTRLTDQELHSKFLNLIADPHHRIDRRGVVDHSPIKRFIDECIEEGKRRCRESPEPSKVKNGN